ncbi:Glutathione import ATP-binding protein GsiA [Calycomorphotria hydatis]|uniref:Glutathione import ATP-binding protein GsiA n=2 Tax=Calycomorphotria hydatis TaxID=2528027 RepID=A0A517T6J9_9PLAN|nr:Glutathione import ATP-binding protein GsiA [Calycomorphotria hydatis]
MLSKRQIRSYVLSSVVPMTELDSFDPVAESLSDNCDGFHGSTLCKVNDSVPETSNGSLVLDNGSPVLEIDQLRTYFHGDEGITKAVDDVTFQIAPGETLGLVGESGSGKSVTSLSVMRLLPEVGASIEGGSISLLGRDMVKLSRSELEDIRGRDISMIFQEPGTSLNPVFKAGWQVAEAIRLHQNVTKAEARQKTIELFDEVGIPDPERRVDSFPHEMSGGQKQRVMIAMALSCNPKLLIADEPTTALDVTIQAQILNLIRKLRDERGMAVLFITHDLGVIAEIADHVAVMYRGKLVEQGSIEDIFQNPQHPYTKGLLACRPKLDSPFRRLPTVSDFMSTTIEADGTLRIEEKSLSEAELLKLEQSGRPRLLHPRSTVESLGYEVPSENTENAPQFVEEGTQPLLSIRNLKVYYPILTGILRRKTGDVKAVDDISLDVYPGQTLGLVGESGCGKTTTGRAILRLIPITDGTVTFENMEVSSMAESKLRGLRRRMQIIFQDPYNSLNPRMSIEAMLTEPMAVHNLAATHPERRDKAAALLEEVGLLPEHLSRYPHEFSGGQRQRICIARALAVEPDFIICDESVSALDVSVQAQVLNLLKDLQEKRGLTYIFISHDLSVVKFMSDMMAVMNAGKIVEFGPSDAIYANPREDYTKRLIAAIPNDSIENIRRLRSEREAAGALRRSNQAV